MKQFNFLVILTLVSFSLKAQFVTIPDTNFRNYIQQNFASAIVGNQLDTTHPTILAATTANVSGRYIVNLSGIRYFDNLTYLDCRNNLLTSLPILPNQLTTLKCDGNTIGTLPTLPNSITQLDCFNNGMSNMTMLPSSLTSLNCYYNNLTSLPILPATLSSLNCWNNQLSSLPSLPASLTSLFCNNNQLTSIPSLPGNLLQLSCYQNQLTSLPALPNTLTNLGCQNNQLLSLPSLPNSIHSLDCSFNQLSSLPSLPTSLSGLACQGNQITGIPPLPANLLSLNCGGNQINSLPPLPSSLTNLTCGGNQITSIPTLPSSLIILHCLNNQLTSLPTIPNSVTQVWCNKNQITTLPNFSNSQTFLNCSENNLTSLPPFPQTLSGLICTDNPNLNCLPAFSQDTFAIFSVRTNTGISCLPKVITVQTSSDSSSYLPVCTPTSGCPIAYNITGNVHHDTSSNCVADSLNNGIFIAGIKLQQFVNGALAQQIYSNENGHYSFDAHIGDSVAVQLDPSNANYLQTSCPISGTRIAELTLLDSVFNHQDFGVKCNGYDLATLSIKGSFRNAIARPVYIRAGDLSQQYNLNCAATVGGTVTTVISGPVTFTAPLIGSLTPTSVAGNTLTYIVPDFGVIDFNTAFNIMVTTDSNASLGSLVCVHTSTSSTIPDLNPLNDTLTFCELTTNSFDPNDKSSFPIDVTSPDEWITYTINFQNTGNDTAYHIFIRDTLSNYLDAATFTYLNGSVQPQISLIGNAILFNYPNINLVDSFTNEAASHGWVQYRVKTKSNLPLNADVENTASIYFDNNLPIVTNTTSNKYEFSTGNVDIVESGEFHLFPNPTNGDFSVMVSELGEFKIYNVVGNVIHKQEITKTKQTVPINLSGLPSGLYIYEFSSANRNKHSGKLMIK